MVQKKINYGAAPNDGTGDLYRVAMIKIDDNFTDLYTLVGGLENSKVAKTATIALSGGATAAATALTSSAITLDVTAIDMSKASGTLAVGHGGTGVTTSTGTGANVQADSPALAGKPTTPLPEADAADGQVANVKYVKDGLSFKANSADVTTALAAKAATSDVNTALALKVDKNGSKVLSDNNYTNDERVKLANIQAAATKNLADAVLLERSNHTGGFNGFGIANPMRNHDPVPFGLAPSAFFNKGSYVGLAHGSEIGIPEMGFGICRVDAHWLDATAGYGVMRSFESTDSRRYTCYATSAEAWSPWRETTHRANLYGTQPLSTISDAGTAASRNVQTSPTDITLGRLMPVGAFGTGRINPVGAMNLSNFGQYPSGRTTYYLNDAFNGPYPNFYGYLEIDKVDDSYVHQTAIGVESGLVYKRTINSGNIGAWIKVLDSKTAVGEIASGGIIERGSNANGEYVKLADGTGIAWGHRIGYVAGENIITMPLGFLGVCGSSLSIIPSTGWQTPNGWYANNSSFVFSMPLANAGNGYVFFATGRWK